MLIGEVSRLSGVSVRMLRHYDRTGLVSPSHRTSTDYRSYDDGDIGRLMKVEALRTLGMSLGEVRAALDDPALDAAAVLTRLQEETRQRVIAEQDLLTRLEDIGGSGPDSWEDVLQVTSLLTTLRSGSSRQRQAAALQSEAGQATAALVESYLEEEDVNAAATLRWSVVRAGEDAVPALLSFEGDSTTDLRIIEALGDIAGDDATDGLRSFLQDAAPGVASTAALALARRGIIDHDLRDRLIGMITDGDHDVEPPNSWRIHRASWLNWRKGSGLCTTPRPASASSRHSVRFPETTRGTS
ncbi:MAG: MerR family transcriptional regulator [Mycobacteriaceae bacterium]|uniref:MerR family transcriptional regulator n=1 Tax=Corynebacterium sp. TaxID=1720 RepID=UPI003F97BF8A